MSKMRVVVMISGRGSNLMSLIDNAENYEVVAVASNKPGAPGLQYARDKSIPVVSLRRADYKTKDEFAVALFDQVEKLKPDLVALAGFMMIIPEEIVNKWQGKLINIHPSLLPKYTGLNTHERALAAGEKEHGCSVHFVDAGVDTGPVVAQIRVDVLEEDSPDSLAERVLKFEHQLYPWVVNSIAREGIWLNTDQAVFNEWAVKEACEMGFILSQK